MDKINIRNMYIDLIHKIRNIEGVDKDYVDGLVELIDRHLTTLDLDINALASVIPDDASTTNQLITANDLPEKYNSDWNATSGPAEILNKPTIPAAQVNSDWNADSGIAAILHKPTIKTPLTFHLEIDSSYWYQPAGETYYYSSWTLGDNIDTSGILLIGIEPSNTTDITPSAAQKTAYDLIFAHRFITSGQYVGIELFASAQPLTTFNIYVFCIGN